MTQQQRDLTNAQTQELSATVTYITARIALDETLGATLENNRVLIDDARNGKVVRTSTLPDAVSADGR